MCMPLSHKEVQLFRVPLPALDDSKHHAVYTLACSRVCLGRRDILTPKCQEVLECRRDLTEHLDEQSLGCTASLSKSTLLHMRVEELRCNFL
jgi:hypothetical protein